MRLGDWGIGIGLVISVAVSFVISVAVSFFIEPVSFVISVPFLFLTKTRKKPLAVFIINTCLYKKCLLYGTFRRILMVPAIEKLLRHGTCCRKI